MIQFQEYLQSDYPGFASFIDTIIKPIFGDNFKADKELQDMIDYPEDIEDFNKISNHKDEDFKALAKETGIERVLELGTIQVQGDTRPIYVYDITVSKRRQLSRNRKGIQQLIARTLNNQSGAFMLFHYGDADWEWRFSYKFVGKDKEDTTNSKRYTYLLGRDQVCKTAAQRFTNLLNKKGKIAFDDITDAFSVEKVSKEFFDHYRSIYADIICYVTGKRMVKAGSKWEEKQEHEPNEFIMQQFAQFAEPEKSVRDYVKKLMGRLVFLQFIQKKGWLGVPADDDTWTKGDKDFVQHLFARCDNKETFIDDVLEPLFADINNRREGDIANSILGEGIKVPYLNGGLFEKDAEDETSFPLPAHYMDEMLNEFFSAYNFTIDENDPSDAEVGVDPEMLGRVFENLLEDNKDKGAFYTPKEIVQYMCRESLIAYLQTDIEDSEIKDSIREFVTTHEISALKSSEVFKVDKKLREVKICDPAIGSGAFPMGLLKELFDCRMTIEGNDEGKTPADIKKDIIQNSIYGVDIEKGAVDIARLRLWLSLIIDEQTPHALPNMDFKIMQGNSLLEQYKGVPLDDIYDSSRQMMLAFDEETTARMLLKEHMYSYFNTEDHNKKSELLQSIDNAVKSLVKAKTLGNPEVSAAIDALDLRNNQEFFLWHTWFNDVFANGGFDIVIGNPPYGLINKRQNQGDGVIVPSEILEQYKKSTFYDAAKGGMLNIFRLFVIHGGSLLKQKGIFCEIFPLAFTCDLSAAKLREHIFNNYTILHIDAFPERDNPQKRVFASAKMSVCIVKFTKEKTRSNRPFSLRINREPYTEELKDCSIYTLKQIKCIDAKNYTIPLTETKDSEVLVKVYSKSSPFGLIGKCYTGEIDMTFCKNAFTKDPSDCKMLRGAHVDRYIERKEISQGETLFLDFNILSTLKKGLGQDLFESPRIIMQGITGVNERIRLKMTLVNNTYCANSVNYCKFNTMDEAKYMLAIFNSKLLNYIFKLLSTNSNVNGYEVDNLPIAKEIQVDYKNRLIKLVDEIFSSKQVSIESDTSALEHEIDLLVYDLYGLTPEEIAIVEG